MRMCCEKPAVLRQQSSSICYFVKRLTFLSRHPFNIYIMGNNRVNVHVSEGKLIGIIIENVYGDKYIAFRGIPYAKPPVGELRFKDPVLPEPWSDDRDASKYGNVAVQLDIFSRQIIGNEDCLYLNVYTTNINPEKKRSVMVWIHGGGFYEGSGDPTFYGPDHIVTKDVVLVTLNYRLGVLGFLNLYDKVATGNQGLKDVVMALQWVQKNISNFGGDSKNVTIFGESAGGAIVHYLAISPLAEGLFHKAISQSGAATNCWAFTEREPPSTNKGFQLAAKLGKATIDAKVAYEFLKKIDAKKLIQTEQNLLSTEEHQQFFIAFTPSMDNESSNPFFPKPLNTLINRGVKVPFLVGYTSAEGTFFIDTNYSNYKISSKEALKQVDSDFKKAISPRVLSKLPEIPITVEELRSLYFGNKAVSEETLQNYADFLGDEAFYRGLMEVVDIQIKSGHNSTYLYNFSYENKACPIRSLIGIKLPGVAHGEDLFYLFYPHMKDFDFILPKLDSEEYKMISRVVQMWTDFAKTGNPTPAITDLIPVKWEPLKNGDTYNYLNIDSKLRMETLRKKEQRWDWENLKRKL